MKNTISQIITTSEKQVNENQDYEMSFTIEEPGFVELHLRAWAESNWSVCDYEAAALRLYVNDVYNQDCILFGGLRPMDYPRLLGYFEPGVYRLRLAFEREISSPKVSVAYIEDVKIRVEAAGSENYLVYKHIPVFYGRNVNHPYESRYTDTPMVVFYSLKKSGGETVIEYQILFSHEDGGTPSALLMSKWGRTTDIEWAYRATIDEQGDLISAVFQGPHHKTTEFAGVYDLGGHPVLQVATMNGNVSDQITSAYRFCFPPMYRWDPENEPRERVMDAYPFTYQVTAWEMLRQQPLERPAVTNSYQLTDLRQYLYVQACKRPGNPEQSTCVDIQVKLKNTGGWYSSSFGDLYFRNFRAAYDGSYANFATTVKLPEGTALSDVEEISAVLLPGGDVTVTVSRLKALFLDNDFLPMEPITTDGFVRLTKDQPKQTLWPEGKVG